jgi:hypothetical protein
MTPEDTGLLIPNRGKGFWRTAHYQAWNDFKTRWRRGLFWVMCFTIFSGLLLELLLVASMRVIYSTEFGSATVCHPNGKFDLNPNTYSYWDASGFFQITMPYGTLTFTQAKTIDVIWDVVGTFSFVYFTN